MPSCACTSTRWSACRGRRLARPPSTPSSTRRRSRARPTSPSPSTAPSPNAMATVDGVNQVGGKAGNFLDIGGGASADVMAAALEVINFDTDVKAILINIFGGITKGTDVANGIVEALTRVAVKAPIVIRLDG